MRTLIASLMIATLAACAADPGEGKPKAKVEDVPAAKAPPAAPPAAPAAAPAAAAPAGDKFTVDAASSKIEALGAKITAQHPIKFKDFTGKVIVNAGQVAQVSYEVKMATLEADAAKLTEHLLTPDFFDVAKFPTATFTSTEIKTGSAEAGFTHTITGDFQIHGVTKRITFPAKLEVKGDAVTANSEFVVNRKDFGLVYPGKPDDLIKDNVKITVALNAKKG